MPIYAKPTRLLMREFVDQMLRPGQVFSRDHAVKWFREHYGKINPNTVRLHVEGMSVNAVTQRKHNPRIQSATGWDLFFKVGRGQYRLYEPATDPQPYYAGVEQPDGTLIDDDEETPGQGDEQDARGRMFALESHLRDYLAHNLEAVEPGLVLYEEEEGGLRGVEFPVGGRFIDLLGTDASGDFVVIELKVSRGYDRALGQLLRYMGWVEKNLANGRQVRGVVIASEITDDLKLAASRLPDVRLIEYEIEFRLKSTNQG